MGPYCIDVATADEMNVLGLGKFNMILAICIFTLSSSRSKILVLNTRSKY
jgi:hypothetical protein